MAYVTDSTTILGMMTSNGTSFIDKICVYELTTPTAGIPVRTLLEAVQTITWASEGYSSVDYVFNIANGETVSGVMFFDSATGIARGDEVLRVPFSETYNFTAAGTFTITNITLDLD